MNTSEAFWQFLPAGLNELFEMVRFEKTDQSYTYGLTDKKKTSDRIYRNPKHSSESYTIMITIQKLIPCVADRSILHMRKIQMVDKKNKRDISYNLELPNEEGTRLSASSAGFLKSRRWRRQLCD